MPQTKTHIRVYNLHAQTLVKTLQSGCKWISSMAIHPSGDNLIVGSYDRRLCWFDLDLSTKPYRTLRYHKLALRQVAFHHSYPLFASCSDDATVNVFHGMVYNDLMQNALIVPVKVMLSTYALPNARQILRGHSIGKDGLGVLDCAFHPRQPWLLTAGADHTARLFV
jgi:ribosome biogenesis protein ERB1